MNARKTGHQKVINTKKTETRQAASQQACKQFGQPVNNCINEFYIFLFYNNSMKLVSKSIYLITFTQ